MRTPRTQLRDAHVLMCVGFSFAAFFALTTAWTIFLLAQQSDANKARHRAEHVSFACLDGNDLARDDKFFTECRPIVWRAEEGSSSHNGKQGVL